MIGVTQDAHSATIWLDRGGTRNALSIAHWHDLAATVTDFAAGNARAVLIASRDPGAFPAGADIAEFAELQRQPDRATAFREALPAAIEGALPLAKQIAARIAANAPQAVRGLKRSLNAEPGGEARFDAAFAGPELREGLAALQSRRPPEFP